MLSHGGLACALMQISSVESARRVPSRPRCPTLQKRHCRAQGHEASLSLLESAFEVAANVVTSRDHQKSADAGSCASGNHDREHDTYDGPRHMMNSQQWWHLRSSLVPSEYEYC